MPATHHPTTTSLPPCTHTHMLAHTRIHTRGNVERRACQLQGQLHVVHSRREVKHVTEHGMEALGAGGVEWAWGEGGRERETA